ADQGRRGLQEGGRARLPCRRLRRGGEGTGSDDAQEDVHEAHDHGQGVRRGQGEGVPGELQDQQLTGRAGGVSRRSASRSARRDPLRRLTPPARPEPTFAGEHTLLQKMIYRLLPILLGVALVSVTLWYWQERSAVPVFDASKYDEEQLFEMELNGAII